MKGMTLTIASFEPNENGGDYTYLVEVNRERVGVITSDAHRHGRSVAAWNGDLSARLGIRASVEQALALVVETLAAAV